MIMANALEDIDFAGQVLQELLGQFGAEYRLDGDWFFRCLRLVELGGVVQLEHGGGVPSISCAVRLGEECVCCRNACQKVSLCATSGPRKKKREVSTHVCQGIMRDGC